MKWDQEEVGYKANSGVIRGLPYNIGPRQTQKQFKIYSCFNEMMFEHFFAVM